MNDDGELELVLGNKQLFSVFFVVVILLGVCFLMGYVVGKNSAPTLNAAVAPPSESRNPLVIPPATEPKEELVPVDSKETEPAQAASQAPKEKATPTKSEPKTVAVKSAPTKVEAKPEPATKTKTPLPSFPAPKSSTEKTTAKASPQVPLGSQPVAGRVYLQLSATERDPAEGMADLLRSKGFSAIAAPIPERNGLYRVLVGPVTDADIPKMRANLKSNSFPADEAVRRVF